jgi:uncharacterized protein (TIGR04255 family)
MKPPKKLTHSPAVDTVIELRVSEDLNVPELYSMLKGLFDGGIEEQGILQLPKNIRESDDKLKYQATHKIKSSDGYYFNVGPHVLGFGYTKKLPDGEDFPGWTAFYARFSEVYKQLKSHGLVNEVTRIGLRYINFFQDDDLLGKLKVGLNAGAEQLGEIEDTNIGLVVLGENSKTRVVINKGASIRVEEFTKKGQIIDIDSVSEDDGHAKPLQTIKGLHTKTKKIFFSIIGDELLAEMGPIYED